MPSIPKGSRFTVLRDRYNLASFMVLDNEDARRCVARMPTKAGAVEVALMFEKRNPPPQFPKCKGCGKGLVGGMDVPEYESDRYHRRCFKKAVTPCV